MRMRIAGAAMMVIEWTTGGYPCLVNIDHMADRVMCTKRPASSRFIGPAFHHERSEGRMNRLRPARAEGEVAA